MIELHPPGDKSISHRALMLAALADGESRLRGLLCGRDVAATARALRALGAAIPPLDVEEARVAGPTGFVAPPDPIDCANSGTTARLLVGLVTGLGVGATLDGDDSLRDRPMDRVVYPLQAMGARIDYLGSPGKLPIRVQARASGSLRTLRHRPRVASAQVKSALLLAGTTGRVAVEVLEPGPSRDHTERMLASMGAPIEVVPAPPDAGTGPTVRLEPAAWDGRLTPLDLEVPGDPSAAAFLIGAAILRRAPLLVRGTSLNPTRLGFAEPLRAMGVEIEARAARRRAGEPVGDLYVRPPERLGPFRVGGPLVPRLIDEIPMLAVLATRADGRSTIRDAAELRVKESDRLALLVRNLEALGVPCAEHPDGLEVEGSSRELAGRVEAGSDHRIAMAFGMLSADPRARVEVDDRECVAVSYPRFWEDLARVAG